MSFAGAYAAESRKAVHLLGPVLEVTLNFPTWNGGTVMNLSSGVVRARNRTYDPRIAKGGWGQIVQEIDVKVSGLSALTASVTVLDPDGAVRAALVTQDQRNSPAVIHRVVPGSATAYDTRFTGLLDTWEFRPNQVQMSFRTDEHALRGEFPRWSYLKSEWFQMPDDFIGTPVPLAYGKLDGTGVTDIGEDSHGIVELIPIYRVTGSINWYGVVLGPASYIKDVYVDGVLKTVTADYNKVYGSLAGGKTFTIVEFVTIPADDAVITANVYGYALVNTGIFDGTDVITNPVLQLRHFLVNFARNRSRGYIPGAWGMSDALIDATSWDAAAAYADAQGLEGARFLDSPQTAFSILDEWLQSFPMFRAYWTTLGTIALRVLDVKWPGYWDGSTPVLGREDDIGNSFRYFTDTSDVAGKVAGRYFYDYVGERFLRTLEVEDLSVTELAELSFDLPWAPSRQVL